MAENRNRPAAQRPPIRGSWEDLLNQADRLAQTRNDEAIPLYRKVMEGLARLPASRREANDSFLQALLNRAANGLQRHLASQQRYREAAEVGQEMQQAVISDEERYTWLFESGKALFLAGEADQAFQLWRSAMAQEDADVLDWSYVLGRYLELGRIAEAEALLQELENRPDDSSDSSDARFDRAFVTGLHAELALYRKEWETAAQWVERAAAIDPDLAYYYANLYIAMIWAGRPAQALELIDREPGAVRANLWRGVCQRKLGNEKAAQRHWKQVIQLAAEKLDEADRTDWILAQYYLGDPKRQGLQFALAVVSREPTIYHLTLTALGWALHGNMANALANLEHAVSQQRAGLQDPILFERGWYLFRDLLDDARFQRVRRFFKEPAAVPQAAG